MIQRLLALGVVLTALLAGPSAAPATAQEAGQEAALAGITQMDAGDAHTCARLNTGQVRCWGYNLFRQLGDGTINGRNLPVAVLNPTGSGPLTGIRSVSGGDAHTCARTTTDQARCWGHNSSGQLGAGDTGPRNLPVVVKGVGGTGRLTGVTQVSAGWNHTCARVTGGQVRCWGGNSESQLGDGTQTPRSAPVVVSNPDGTGPLTGVTQVSAGLYFTCARLNTGRAVCWGNNTSNQLGDSTNQERSRPVFVRNSANTGPLGSVAQVVTGYYNACARLTNGQARCWGGSPAGSPLPVGVLNSSGSGPLGGIASLANGTGHVCARLTNGQVRCFGANGQGQLGDRSTTPRALPVAMVNTAGTSSLTGVLAVTAGEAHSCAVLGTGQAVCVGDNSAGQLGDGIGATTSRPVGVRR